MNLTLKIWRQADVNANGKMVTYSISDVSPDMSFLEMMDMITIVVREYVVCVRCSSTERPMAQID